MIESELTYELKIKLKKLADYLWPKEITWPKIEQWLNNFSNVSDNDKIQLLYLLSQFMYFDTREIRELLKCIYRDKYRYSLIQNIATEDHKELAEQLKIEETQTRFIPVGNPSESGSHLLYYFRQENKLTKDLFINASDIFKFELDKEDTTKSRICIANENIKHYVFIDDLCGSGHQAKQYLLEKCKAIKNLSQNSKIHYYTMFAMSEGLNLVRDTGIFDNVDTIFRLDNSFRCFDPESRYYKNSKEPISRTDCVNICWKFGKKLGYREHSLGYNDSQLLIGFYYNTPDNTLPVIWSNEPGWSPIFKRYGKF